MSISKKIRFEVFKRDGFVCQYCGNTPPTVVLEVDHVIARSAGGVDEMDNLITACFDCNRGKGKRDLSSVPDKVKKNVEQAKKRAEQLKAYYEHQREIEEEIELTIDALDEKWSRYFDYEYTFNSRGRLTIKRFLAQLPYSEITEAIDIAAERVRLPEQRFKYLCGILHNKVKAKTVVGV